MGIDKTTINNWCSACGDDTESFDKISYEIIKRFEGIVNSQINHFNDVLEFHKKFGHLNATVPRHLTKRKLLERIKFLQEELDEFAQGCGIATGYTDDDGNYFNSGYTNNGGDQNMPEMADALVDLVYVALGTAVMMGLPWKDLWDDVQRANMEKERGVGHRGNLVDCVKPIGWEGPKTLEILIRHGYNPDQATNIRSHADDEVHMSNNNI